MVSWGLLARTVKASQSIVRVKLDSMEPIELLYRALWVAPPLPRQGHSGPPRSYRHAARTGFASAKGQ